MEADSIRFYGYPKCDVLQYYSFIIPRDCLTEDEREVYDRHLSVITKMSAQVFISGQYANIDDHDFMIVMNAIFNKETEDHGAKFETINNLIKKFLESEIFITDKADPRKDIVITENMAKKIQFHELLDFLNLEDYLDYEDNINVQEVMRIFIIEHGKQAGWII